MNNKHDNDRNNNINKTNYNNKNKFNINSRIKINYFIFNKDNILKLYTINYNKY